MRFKITNKGPARTVDFLAVFAKGETKEFSEDEIEAYQGHFGVPLFSTPLADEDEFDVEVISEGETK